MNIELTDKEFRRLLDLVYIGNWILNSTREKDRFEDYDILQEKLFAQCTKNGMNALISRWQGHNISFGFPVLKYVAKLSEKPLDVHLMIVQPEKFIQEVKALGAHVMTVHYEACPHLHRVVQQIREAGMQPAVTINPATPVAMLQDIIRDVYMVLIMSVNPGFGGQKFIEHSVEKVRELRALIERTGSKALIEVDGGVNVETGARLVAAGADILAAG